MRSCIACKTSHHRPWRGRSSPPPTHPCRRRFLQKQPVSVQVSAIPIHAQNSQHWKSSRSEYAAGRQGYLQWRTNLNKYHADTTGELVKAASYDNETIERVKKAVGKKAIKVNRDTQLFEDVVDLVFIERYVFDFAGKHPEYDEEKWLDSVRKTCKKVSDSAQQFTLAGKIELPELLILPIQKAVG